MPHLLYIGQTPVEGTGSPIIVLRHLRRLAAHGWTITIIGEHGNDPSACIAAGWSVKTLPHRRAWWPPFNPAKAFSRTLRTWLLARECRQVVAKNAPDAVLGYLAAHADFSAEIAAHFARQTGCPFTLLVHDDAADFATDEKQKKALRRRHAWIIRQTHRCWFVSPELARVYNVPDSFHRVLAPLPAGWSDAAQWHPARAQPVRVVYAGFIWPAQFPLLKRLAIKLDSVGALLVLQTKDTPELRAFLTEAPADWTPPFASNHDALRHLATTATAVIVAYADTVADMPWIATSFPSKLIEYAHLGLPCAIAAPAESAVGHWAAENAFPDFFTPDQLDALLAWCRDLSDSGTWQQRSQRMLNLSSTLFSPEKLHARFEQELLR